MINDRHQKELALRYVASRRWVPQLEVEVYPDLTTTDSKYVITDLDVLALVPDEFDGYRSIIIDCKTRKAESPIGRALWLTGLSKHIGAERAFSILQKKRIETDHRYSAAQHGVIMLGESE